MKYSTDVELGKKVHGWLVGLGLETPMVNYEPHNLGINGCKDGPMYNSIRVNQEAIMEALQLNMEDDSLKDTPKRIAKMYCQELFTGLDYANFPKCTTVENKMRYDEMLSVKDIAVKSFCEHHFLPFIGTAAIGYIPNKKVLGLSKFNRIVDFFSRRPQIQERLTEQIAAALSNILGTTDIAVVIKADHFCVKLRGVEDDCSSTISSKMSGRFRDNPALRQEFLSLA